MDANVKNVLAHIDTDYKYFDYKRKPMTKAEVKAVLECALEKGYESTSELKDEEVDAVLNKVNG